MQRPSAALFALALLGCQPQQPPQGAPPAPPSAYASRALPLPARLTLAHQASSPVELHPLRGGLVVRSGTQMLVATERGLGRLPPLPDDPGPGMPSALTVFGAPPAALAVALLPVGVRMPAPTSYLRLAQGRWQPDRSAPQGFSTALPVAWPGGRVLTGQAGDAGLFGPGEGEHGPLPSSLASLCDGTAVPTLVALSESDTAIVRFWCSQHSGAPAAHRHALLRGDGATPLSFASKPGDAYWSRLSVSDGPQGTFVVYHDAQQQGAVCRVEGDRCVDEAPALDGAPARPIAVAAAGKTLVVLARSMAPSSAGRTVLLTRTGAGAYQPLPVLHDGLPAEDTSRLRLTDIAFSQGFLHLAGTIGDPGPNARHVLLTAPLAP